MLHVVWFAAWVLANVGALPIRPFDPDRSEPVLFSPGDRVRFHPIDRETFEQSLLT